MNKAKWLNPEISISDLALKLCEEAAEVGGEITDMRMDGETMSPPYTREAQLLKELTHVEFITDVIRARISTDPHALVRIAQKYLGGTK